MNQKVKKVMALVLVGVLALTGCGQKKEEKPTIQKESAASVDKGTLKGNSKVIAVGKTTISYNEYQAYSYILKSRYENVLDSNVWNYSMSKGKTIGMDAVNDTIRLLIQLKVIGKSASSIGVSLGANEKEELTYEAKKYVEALPEDIRNQYGITTQLVTDMLCDNEIARKAYDVITGAVDANITDDEARVVKTQAIYLVTKGKNEKTGESVDLNEADKAALFETAKQLQTQAQSGGFYALAEKNSARSEVELDIGPEDTPKELVDTAFTLKAGDVSPVISTSQGFYILNCISVNDPNAMNEHRQKLIQEKQVKKFQETYRSWSDKFGVRVSKSLLQ